jgi:hypothetical protein
MFASSRHDRGRPFGAPSEPMEPPATGVETVDVHGEASPRGDPRNRRIDGAAAHQEFENRVTRLMREDGVTLAGSRLS